MPRGKNKGKDGVVNVKSSEENIDKGGVKNIEPEQNANSAITNKPVLVEGGRIDAPTKKEILTGADSVNSDTTLEKVVINGDKASLSTIDSDGNLKSIEPGNMKPEVIGDGLIPKVAMNNQVYSLSGYTPSRSLLNDINYVLSPTVSLYIKFPEIRFKPINEVPIHIGYEFFENKTVKAVYRPLVKIEYDQFKSFVSLFNAYITNWLVYVDKYDVVWTDFDSGSDFSVINGKRIKRNLSLKDEDWKNPMNIPDKLEGHDFSYDRIMAGYFADNTPVKDNIGNLRLNNKFRIDTESYKYLSYLLRPAVRNTSNGWTNVKSFLGLPYDFKFGMPSDNELNSFFSTTTNLNYFVRPRGQLLYQNKAIESRSLYYNLSLDDGRLDRVKLLIKTYNVLFEKCNVFSGVLRNAFLSSIEFAASVSNKLSSYYGNTEFGVTALRKTAATAVIAGLSPSSVPGFINSIIQLYFEPRTALVFQLDAEYSVNWTFNAVMFMFLMKPEVSPRSAVGALVSTVVANLCKVSRLNFLNTQTGLESLGEMFSSLLVRTLKKWYDYSLSRVDLVRDHARLFTNRGDLGNRGILGNYSRINQASGYVFWGSAAINPWAEYPDSEDDKSFIDKIIELFRTRTQYAWTNIWTDLVMTVTNNPEYNFVTSLHRLINTLNLFATSELNMNRFSTTVRDKLLVIDHRSVFSFAMYSKISDIPYYHSNLQPFYLFLLSLDYYMSEVTMFYKVFKEMERNLIPVVGLSGYSNTYYKEWEMLNLAGSYSNHELVKSLFSNIEYNNINQFSLGLGGFNYLGKSLMEVMIEMYAGDFSTNHVSRWFIQMRALDIVLDTSEWSKFGLVTHFDVGQVDLDIQGNQIFKVKKQIDPPTLRVNYRDNFLKFGSYEYSKSLLVTHRGECMRFEIPTFVEYKIVQKLSDGSNFTASTGETDVVDWIYTKKEPVTSDEFRVDCVKVTKEVVVKWDKTYQYQVLFFDKDTVTTDSTYFVNDRSDIDVEYLLVTLPELADDFYLEGLGNVSIEFNQMFSSDFSKSNGFESRFSNYLNIV